MKKIVHILTLRGGSKLMWIIDQQTSMRVPVVRHSRNRVRLINNKSDNLLFCDVLDAIMAERRAKTYERDGVNERSRRVERKEMEVVKGGGSWLPVDWAIIAFNGWDMDLRHYQRSIRETRAFLADNRSSRASARH